MPNMTAHQLRDAQTQMAYKLPHKHLQQYTNNTNIKCDTRLLGQGCCGDLNEGNLPNGCHVELFCSFNDISLKHHTVFTPSVMVSDLSVSFRVTSSVWADAHILPGAQSRFTYGTFFGVLEEYAGVHVNFTCTVNISLLLNFHRLTDKYLQKLQNFQCAFYCACSGIPEILSISYTVEILQM